MAKKSDVEYIYTTGGNLANGSRFEAGDSVKASELSKEDLEALLEMGALAEK
jgi:hypothetical protein